MSFLGMLSPTVVCAALACALLNHAARGAEVAPGEWIKTNALRGDYVFKMPDSPLQWVDARNLTIEGRAFDGTLTPYSRLRTSDKAKVTTGVWTNGENSAGVAVRFVTDATSISANWDNDAPMVHMAFTGSGGLDLYAREDGEWVYRGTGMPTAFKTTATAVLQKYVKGKPAPTEYLLFLPLYSKVEKLEIGVPPEFSIAAAPPTYEGMDPIVFYGTSITQGGCASRAGMVHTSILRRWLDVPVINLGFSGSGRCEPAMCEVLSDIPAQLYVLETVPNMTLAMLDERVVPFVRQLRKNHPSTPILMIESPNVDKDVAANKRWKAAYDELIKDEKIPDLHYLAGDNLYEPGEDPTVDGVHPTDLGFAQMAKAYKPVIEQLLKPKK